VYVQWNSAERVPLHVGEPEEDFDILLEIYSEEGNLLDVYKTVETSEVDGTVSVRVWVTGAKPSVQKISTQPLDVEKYHVYIIATDRTPEALSVLDHERKGKTLRLKVGSCQ
jgi:hypothetical protein